MFTYLYIDTGNSKKNNINFIWRIYFNFDSFSNLIHFYRQVQGEENIVLRQKIKLVISKKSNSHETGPFANLDALKCYTGKIFLWTFLNQI